MIVGAELTNIVAECPHLITLVKQVVGVENSGTTSAEVTADAAHFSPDRVQTLHAMENDPRIPADGIGHA